MPYFACSGARRRVLMLLLVWLSLVSSGVAKQYPIQTYTEADGMPCTAVYGIAADSRGRLWLATRTGVSMYDGFAWTHYGVEAGLGVADQRDIAVGSDDRVWALSKYREPGVRYLEGGRWIPLPEPKHTVFGYQARYLAVGCDADGRPLAAVVTVDGGLAIWNGDLWIELAGRERTAEPSSLVAYGDGFYLSSPGGLGRLTVEEGRIVVVWVPDLPDGRVYGTAVTVDGNLKIAGPGWLGTLSERGFILDAEVPELVLSEATGDVAMACDVLGGTYLGGPDDVFYQHPDIGVEKLTQANGLVSTGITDALADREGSVWLPCLRGLSKVSARGFTAYDHRDGLFDDEVCAVLERRDGTVVLGHTGGLTWLGDEGIETIDLVHPDGLRARVSDLEEAPDGTLWLAVDRAGLARMDQQGRVTWFVDGPLGGLPIYGVCFDGDDRLWVGGVDGVWRWDGRRFIPVDMALDVAERNGFAARRLIRDEGDGVFVATSRHGVFRLDGANVQRWTNPAAESFTSAYSVCATPFGEIWVGTSGGLCRIEDGQVMPIHPPGPVIHRPVYAITEDSRGGVWLGTDRGVFRWDGAVLAEYGTSRGLLGTEVNRDAVTLDSQGRIWVGTDRGVSVYDSRFSHRTTSRLLAWIERIEVDGVPTTLNAPLTLSHRFEELVVHFRATGLRDEQTVCFRTYLEGFDESWSDIGRRPSYSIRYTQLPAGRFVFHAQAVDAAGRKSAILSSHEIIVEPPVWGRFWFRALVVLVAVALVWLVGAAVYGRRYARRLEAQVAERTWALAASERAVRSESQRLSTVLANISNGVMVVDAEGQLVLCNQMAGTILNRPVEDICHTSVEPLLPGVWQRALALLAEDAGRDNAGDQVPLHFELELTRADKGTREIEFSVARLPATEHPEADVVLVFRDVTDRRRVESERIRGQKLESLGLLAGGIAHDFNNLLTVVLGNISIVADSPSLSGTDTVCLRDARSALVRARGLTGQLLTFARGGQPHMELTDLGSLVEQAAKLAISGTTARLVVDLPANLHHARVDRAQIEQVISNLVINSNQAMPDGGCVWVTGRNVNPGRTTGTTADHVQIRVRDEGTGIAAEHIERIFEPYFTTKDGGSGLGLAVAYSVVSRHGGQLEAVGNPGQGAEFRVMLPASDRRVVDEPVATPIAGDGGGRILVLDDEDEVRTILIRILASLGFDAEGVADGDEAVAAYQAALEAGRRFDVVVMDLTVPGGVGGLAAIERLRRLDPEVVAVVASGYSNDPVMSDHERYGFRASIRKPFDRAALEATLARVLSGGGTAG